MLDLPKNPPRQSGWITRDYKEDGSLIDAKTKDFDIALVYLVIVFCVIIAMGGITESEWRHNSPKWRLAVAPIIGGVVLGILLYIIYVSVQIKRVRLDQRGAIYTVGGRLKAKIAWKDVSSAECYQRQGGLTMNEEIKGIRITSKTGTVLKMESDVFGQESLDKTINLS